MPCDSRIKIQLTLSPARVDVLDSAMESLGWIKMREGEWGKYGYGTVRLVGGSLEIPGGALDWKSRSNETESLKKSIVQATSREIVNRAAKQNGWHLSWLSDNRADAKKITYGV